MCVCVCLCAYVCMCVCVSVCGIAVFPSYSQVICIVKPPSNNHLVQCSPPFLFFILLAHCLAVAVCTASCCLIPTRTGSCWWAPCCMPAQRRMISFHKASEEVGHGCQKPALDTCPAAVSPACAWGLLEESLSPTVPGQLSPA